MKKGRDKTRLTNTYDTIMIYIWQTVQRITKHGKVHLGPVYTKRQRQCCNDACDSVLIENSGVACKWVVNPFWSDTTVFNENRIASVIAGLTLTLGINGPLKPSSHRNTNLKIKWLMIKKTNKWHNLCHKLAALLYCVTNVRILQLHGKNYTMQFSRFLIVYSDDWL